MIKTELRYSSRALGMPTSATVLLPQDVIGEKPAPYKCLYLLHGMHGDSTSWIRNSAIERYAGQYNICVVMPEAHDSFYTDMKYGKAYYTAIAEELPRLICNTFNVSDKREDTFVAGLSMGGYGALKIALRAHERFCAGAGLSSAADMEVRAKRCFGEPGYFMDCIFGPERIVPEEDNLFSLAKAAEKKATKPRIYVACGTEDALYPMNVKFNEAMQNMDFDYTYREGPGAHTWDYWDAQIVEVLRWMFGE